MSVSGIGGVGGISLSQLAQAYRQQVLSGQAAGGASATAAGATAATAGSSAAAATDPAAAARGSQFASAVGNGLTSLERLDQAAAGKAVQAATGDLRDVQDYIIAANKAQVATELTTTVRNKAVEAFNEIMRMPL